MNNLKENHLHHVFSHELKKGDLICPVDGPFDKFLMIIDFNKNGITITDSKFLIEERNDSSFYRLNKEN